MKNLQIAPDGFKFPVGWHSILHEFILDVLAVEYLYGEVVASVSVDRSPVHAKLRVYLLSEAPRQVREEASNVLEQIHGRIHERARDTCSICGEPARGAMVSHCGDHSDIQLVPYAELKPPTDPAWRVRDFHMLIEGGTQEDVIRTMANNQKQMDAATAFVKNYDAPEVSQLLARVHAMRAMWAIEDILQRSAFAAQAGAFETGS